MPATLAGPSALALTAPASEPERCFCGREIGGEAEEFAGAAAQPDGAQALAEVAGFGAESHPGLALDAALRIGGGDGDFLFHGGLGAVVDAADARQFGRPA
jgi:hypothetical protein